MKLADLHTYTVYQQLSRGSQFVSDYNEAAAMAHVLELHPDASPEAVCAELAAEIERRERRHRN